MDTGRTFIEVPTFTKKWHALGLTDDDLKKLQEELLQNPKLGAVIQGTGGMRKIRIPLECKETIYLINVYTKDEKDDLTDDERKAFKAVIKILKEE